MSSRCRISLAAAAVLLACTSARAEALRVCTEPNNMPFSNRAGEGFENRIAAILARELGRELLPVLIAQHGPGFIRSTLGTGRCDAIMGMPLGSAGVDLTKPYYRTSWVFVSRFEPPGSFDDPRLRALSIGVPVVGEGADTAPLIALGRRKVVGKLHYYSVGGDLGDGDNTPEEMVQDLAKGAIDLAVMWGPSAGYFAAKQGVALQIAPTPRDDGPNVPFALSIAIAVKRGSQLREALDAALERNRDAIAAVLADYHVPLVAD
ncbi:MAG TPA: quinoprotein dehydrogenase-associated putative ABC transporter substrate-binding protein [Acetobacteraceae bacterium]|nr:quinoprotein dehydrogenase-associated putative ABC transporter substrate-binding protein [Acetobacteraceae bacterium]